MNRVRQGLQWLRNVLTHSAFKQSARLARQHRLLKQRRWLFRPIGEALEIRITPTSSNYYLVTSLDDAAGTLTTTGSGIDGSQAHPYQDTTLRGAIAAATADGGD